MSNKVDNFLDKKLEEIQNKKFEENQAKIQAKNEKIEKNKNKRKGIIISATSLILAALIAIGCHFGFKKKNNNNDIPKKPAITTVDDLGMDEEFDNSDDSKLYGNTTGNINKEDILEKDGTVYKDKEAADKSNQVGNKKTDLQNGKLEIDKDGDVVVKDEVDYVIKNEKGEEISSGTISKDETPDGYEYDKNTDSLVKDDDYNRFTIVDANYYDMNGDLVYEKGEKVLKETYEKLKNDPNFSTVKPTVNTSSTTTSSNTSSTTTSSNTSSTTTSSNTSSTTTSSNNTSSETTSTTEKVDEGKVNADGTFTIAGVTFIDKATYQAVVLGECNEEDLRYNENGVIYIKENTNSKTR